MMRVSFIISILFFSLTACAMGKTIKGHVKNLQDLKTQCENLQLELEAIGAKKWPKALNEKVKECKEHGFWAKRKRVLKTFTEGIDFKD